MIYLSFCERLKEERLSKGLNQDDFSAVGEVTKRSQINYEKGDRVPDSDYLMNLLKIGVDVNYILTGNRDVSDPVIQALANAFKNADEGTRQVVCRVLDLDLSKIKDDADQNKPKKDGQRVFKNINQYVEGGQAIYKQVIKKED